MSVHSSKFDFARRARRPAVRRFFGGEGFTLIELFVVIAIIAVLAAMLFPAGVKVLEGSRRSKCLSNLSGIGKGFHLYMADNDIFPQKGTKQPQDWLFHLRPYLSTNNDATLCPVPIVQNGKTNVFRSTMDTNLVTNYGVSYWLAEGMATGGTGVTAKRVPRPSNVYPASKVGVLIDSYNNWLRDTQTARVRFAHGSKANVLYFDGHVESGTREQLIGNNGKLACMSEQK